MSRKNINWDALKKAFYERPTKEMWETKVPTYYGMGYEHANMLDAQESKNNNSIVDHVEDIQSMTDCLNTSINAKNFTDANEQTKILIKKLKDLKSLINGK